MAEFSQTVTDTNNDAWERDSNTGFATTDINNHVSAGTTSGGRENTGIRFTNVTIPKGSTIDSAVLTVTFAGTSFDTIQGDIFCEDVDDSPNFVDTPDVTDRTRTAASVSWEEVDSNGNSPDFASVVQEVINRNGWVSGNALTVLIDGKNQAGDQALFRDVSNGSGAPSIVINYTEPSGAAGFIKRRRSLP